MTQRNSGTHAGHSHLQFHLKLVGKVALIVGAIAFGGLLALLLLISDSSGDAYWEVVKSRSITQQSLGPSMVLAGCFLVGAAAIVTWVISLYASFRVAGPLFRFARNIETLMQTGSASIIPIRQKDELQDEARELHDAVDRLRGHYREVGGATDTALAAIDGGDAGVRDLVQSIATLQELDRHVRC